MYIQALQNDVIMSIILKGGMTSLWQGLFLYAFLGLLFIKLGRGIARISYIFTDSCTDKIYEDGHYLYIHHREMPIETNAILDVCVVFNSFGQSLSSPPPVHTYIHKGGVVLNKILSLF